MTEPELKFILSEGEGPFIEFKEKVGKSLAREMVAFANAIGGHILLGVSDDSTPVGIRIDNRLKSTIQDMARNCDPSLFVELKTVGNILIVDVHEGINKPYACSDGFFIRIGANSQKLSRDEILDIAVRTGKIRFDEQICEDFNWDDFDEGKFQNYLKIAQVTAELSRNDILTNLNVLTKHGITNAGVLFFAKTPSKYIRSSNVVCALFQGNDKYKILDKKVFDGGLLENISTLIEYVERHIDVEFVIKKLEREEIPQYPQEAYREAIINAVMHRDYFDLSEELVVEVYRKKLIIRNPGRLLGLTVEDLGKKSRIRNTIIADLLLRTPYVEKLGTGFVRMNTAMQRSDLKPVSVCVDDFSFAIELSSDRGKVTDKLTVSQKKILESAQKATPKATLKNTPKNTPKTRDRLLDLIRETPEITREQMAELLGISVNGVKQQVKKLKEKGALTRIGSHRGGYWEVVSSKNGEKKND